MVFNMVEMHIPGKFEVMKRLIGFFFEIAAMFYLFCNFEGCKKFGVKIFGSELEVTFTVIVENIFITSFCFNGT